MKYKGYSIKQKVSKFRRGGSSRIKYLVIDKSGDDVGIFSTLQDAQDAIDKID